MAEISNPVLRHLLSYRRYERPGRLLADGKPFWGIVKDLETDLRNLLTHQRILSILNIPVNVAGAWYGFIGFDTRKSPREWSDEDVRLLQTGAEMVGSYLDGSARWRSWPGQGEDGQDIPHRSLRHRHGRGQGVHRSEREALPPFTATRRKSFIGQNARILYAEQAEYDRVGTDTLATIARERTGIETQWQRKDGTVVDILLSSSPLVPDESSRGIFSSPCSTSPSAPLRSGSGA